MQGPFGGCLVLRSPSDTQEGEDHPKPVEKPCWSRHLAVTRTAAEDQGAGRSIRAAIVDKGSVLSCIGLMPAWVLCGENCGGEIHGNHRQSADGLLSEIQAKPGRGFKSPPRGLLRKLDFPPFRSLEDVEIMEKFMGKESHVKRVLFLLNNIHPVSVL